MIKNFLNSGSENEKAPLKALNCRQTEPCFFSCSLSFRPYAAVYTQPNHRDRLQPQTHIFCIMVDMDSRIIEIGFSPVLIDTSACKQGTSAHIGNIRLFAVYVNIKIYFVYFLSSRFAVTHVCLFRQAGSAFDRNTQGVSVKSPLRAGQTRYIRYRNIGCIIVVSITFLLLRFLRICMPRAEY